MNSFLPDLPPALEKNPFFQFSEETNFLPVWDKIKPRHVMPAFEYAFAQTQKKLDALLDNQEPPTFENTVEALDESYELLFYFFRTFFNLMPEDKKVADLYEDIQEKLFLRFLDLFGDFMQNPDLCNRFAKIDADDRKVSSERRQIYHAWMNSFRDSGVLLSKKKREDLRAIDRQIVLEELKSNNNIKKAEETTFLVVKNKADLQGLSDFSMQAAARKARETGHPGRWVFGVDAESRGPFMASVKSRELRKKLYKLHYSVGVKGRYNNQKTVLTLASLRYQSARMTGYKSSAVKTLQYQVAGDPQTVAATLNGIRLAATPSAEMELGILSAFAYTTDGIKKLEPWDIEYYKEQLKKKTLGFDDEELRPYFELEKVLTGILAHFSRQLDIRFEQTHDYPVPHKDARLYKAYDSRSGKFIGTLCIDPFDRKGKMAYQAWHSTVFPQGLFMGKNRRPNGMVNTRLLKGNQNQPTLLTHDNICTLLHEIGHDVHGLCSKCRYSSESGTSVKTDFVEFPSQIQENWAFEPEFLDTIAFHYQTGAPLSTAVKQSIKESRKFMAGSEALFQAKRGWIDLAWHAIDPRKIKNIRDFEEKTLKPFRVFPHKGEILSPAFTHVFGGGYGCGYYSYQFSQIWEADAFAAFEKEGLYNRRLCQGLKKMLEKGDTVHPRLLFQEFRHRQPSHKAFMARKGFAGNAFNYIARMDEVEAQAAAPANVVQIPSQPKPEPMAA